MCGNHLPHTYIIRRTLSMENKCTGTSNDQIEDEAYYVDSITQQSDTEVWFSLKNKDLNKQYVFKYKGNELIPDRLVD